MTRRSGGLRWRVASGRFDGSTQIICNFFFFTKSKTYSVEKAERKTFLHSVLAYRNIVSAESASFTIGYKLEFLARSKCRAGFETHEKRKL